MLALFLLNAIFALAVVQDHDDDDHEYDLPLPSGDQTIRLIVKENGDDFRNLVKAVQLLARDTVAAVNALKASTSTISANLDTLNELADTFSSVIQVSPAGNEGTATPTALSLRKRAPNAACKTITLFGNVRVISGSATSDASSCGNLVTGYQQQFANVSGSHNVIVSASQAATVPNAPVSAASSSVVGGSANVVLGVANTVASRFGVVGGLGNTQNGEFASIIGGTNGAVTKAWGTILTGVNNVVSGLFGVVITGVNDNAAGAESVSVSGQNDTESGPFSVIVSGKQNIIGAAGNFSGIFSGQSNLANQTEGVIIDGVGDQVLSNSSATTIGSVVIDGQNNVAVGQWGVDVAGKNNLVGGLDAVAVAGQSNNVTSSFQAELNSTNASV